MHRSSHRPARGFSLVEILSGLAVVAVLTAVMLGQARSHTQNQRTQLILRQVLDLRDTVQAFRATHGRLPDSADLIAQHLVPTAMVSGGSLVHAGKGTVQIGRYGNALGDGRPGYVIAVNGLDAAACRTVAAGLRDAFAGLMVSNTGDATCTDGCHQLGVIGRDYGGSLAAYEAAGGRPSDYVRETMTQYGWNPDWLSAADNFAANFGEVSPFGTHLKNEKLAPEADFNRAFQANLEQACPPGTAAVNLKLIGR
jgi:prepilin-type N-terminal cleavage/methylation domain-containing protein